MEIKPQPIISTFFVELIRYDMIITTLQCAIERLVYNGGMMGNTTGANVLFFLKAHIGHFVTV